MIVRKIRRDIEAGALPPGTDAEALARFTTSTLSGLAQAARDGATRAQLVPVAEVAIGAWLTLST
jgi:hypothetical protein